MKFHDERATDVSKAVVHMSPNHRISHIPEVSACLLDGLSEVTYWLLSCKEGHPPAHFLGIQQGLMLGETVCAPPRWLATVAVPAPAAIHKIWLAFVHCCVPCHCCIQVPDSSSSLGATCKTSILGAFPRAVHDSNRYFFSAQPGLSVLKVQFFLVSFNTTSPLPSHKLITRLKVHH